MVDTDHLNMNEIVTIPNKANMFVVLVWTDYFILLQRLGARNNTFRLFVHTPKISKVKFSVHNKILVVFKHL